MPVSGSFNPSGGMNYSISGAVPGGPGVTVATAGSRGGLLPPTNYSSVASPKSGFMSKFLQGLLGSLPSGLFGLLQTGLSGLITGLQNKKQREWTERQSDIAYQRQIAQWNRENAYNSPAAQVARLRAAGINVNDSFSGQGAATAGGLSNVAMPQMSPLDISSSMSGMIGAMASGAQARVAEGQLQNDTIRNNYLNALTSVQASQVKEQIKNTALDSAYKSVLLKYLDTSEQIRLSRDVAAINLTGSQQAYVDKQVQFYADRISAAIAVDYATASERRKQVSYLDSLISKASQDIQESLSRQGVNEKVAKYYGSIAVTNMIYGGIHAVSDAAGAVSSFLPFGGNKLSGAAKRASSIWMPNSSEGFSPYSL